MKIEPELRPETSQASLTIPTTTSAPMPPRSFLPSQSMNLTLQILNMAANLEILSL